MSAMTRAERVAELIAERFGLHDPPMRYGLRETAYAHDEVFDDCDLITRRRLQTLRTEVVRWQACAGARDPTTEHRQNDPEPDPDEVE